MGQTTAIEAERRTAPASKFFLGGSIKVRDVTAHSLGMVAENADRSKYVNSIIIRKNQAIPSNETRPFQQKVVAGRSGETEVFVLQGESERALDNSILGRYVISGIEAEAKEHAVIDVTYSYDENGIVDVDAIQRSSGKVLLVTKEELPDDLDWLDESPRDRDAAHIQHMEVFLAVDLSGSMSGDPLAEAQKAAKRFVQDIDLSNASIGLNVFANDYDTHLDLSQSAKDLVAGIDQWSQIYDTGKVGYGNSGHPFDDLRNRFRNEQSRRFVVVLTDGVWFCKSSALASAQILKDDGAEIIALGFGGADKKFLNRLASSDERALFTDLSKLSSEFSRIAQVMTDSQSSLSAASPEHLNFFN